MSVLSFDQSAFSAVGTNFRLGGPSSLYYPASIIKAEICPLYCLFGLFICLFEKDRNKSH